MIPFALRIFSDLAASRFAANAKLTTTVVQTLRLLSPSCEGMVPGKIFNSRFNPATWNLSAPAGEGKRRDQREVALF
jgi:hypothetical protein